MGLGPIPTTYASFDICSKSHTTYSTPLQLRIMRLRRKNVSKRGLYENDQADSQGITRDPRQRTATGVSHILLMQLFSHSATYLIAQMHGMPRQGKELFKYSPVPRHTLGKWIFLLNRVVGSITNLHYVLRKITGQVDITYHGAGNVSSNRKISAGVQVSQSMCSPRSTVFLPPHKTPHLLVLVTTEVALVTTEVKRICKVLD